MPAKDVTVTGTATPITYTITYNLDGGTVSTANPTTYTVETETFTLKNPTRSGYYFVGWSAFAGGVKSINRTILKGSTGDRTYIANWKQSPVALGWTDSYNADGTEERPYLISDSYGWDFLVNELQTKNYSNYSGKIFKLTDDITVTEMLGTNGKEFSGIFDGNGKTLTFDYENATALIIAPFKYVKGATIKDLTVAGTINSSRKDGGNKYIGGLIQRVNEGETTIENCKFVGKLLATDSADAYGGGFVVHNSGTLTINGCLYAPAELEDGETEPSKDGTATFVRNGTGTSTITNSYYTRTLGIAQGEQIYTVTADYDITIELAGDSENVLTYDGTIYAGSGKTLSLTISGGNTKDGYRFMGYTASAGTLTESGGKYSLTMPEGNVTISAKFAQLYSVTISEAITNGTITADKAQAIKDETITLTVAPATGYAVSVVKYNDTAITPENESYTFAMPAENVTLTAEFSAVNYGVGFDGGITDGLMTSDKTTANYGDTVTLAVQAGYEAKNVSVKNGETVITVTDNGNGRYSFTMPAGAVTVEADITPISYTITYELDGGTVATVNPTSYTIKTETFTLTNPTKNGSTFAGWTGTGLSGATMTVEIAQGSTGARTYTATWTGGGSTPDPNAPVFRGQTLILGGQIGVIFYVDIPETYRNPNDCWMEFEVSGDEFSTSDRRPQSYNEDDYIAGPSGENCYKFTCYINSVQMADNINAILHYGSGCDTVTYQYTALTYLNRAMNANSGYEADVVALATAINDFGSYVQPVLAEENHWQYGVDHVKMNAVSSYSDNDFERVKSAASSYALNYDKSSSTTAGIANIGHTLQLESTTTLIMYLAPSSDYTGKVYVKVDNGTEEEADYSSGNNYYVVIIENIAPHELDDPHTITVRTEKGTFDITVYALSYVNSVLNSANSNAMKEAGDTL